MKTAMEIVKEFYQLFSVKISTDALKLLSEDFTAVLHRNGVGAFYNREEFIQMVTHDHFQYVKSITGHDKTSYENLSDTLVRINFDYIQHRKAGLSLFDNQNKDMRMHGTMDLTVDTATGKITKFVPTYVVNELIDIPFLNAQPRLSM